MITDLFISEFEESISESCTYIISVINDGYTYEKAVDIDELKEYIFMYKNMKINHIELSNNIINIWNSV